jgi:protein-tyrosine phosphatase
VLRHLVREAGLADRIRVDSAGTTDYHVGSPPDERSAQHARRRGYDLSDLRARQVQPLDFERFDLILCMDRGHLEELEDLCPPAQRHKVKLLMDFAPHLGAEVADPYYGGKQGFETVLDQVEAACAAVLRSLCTAEKPENPSS